MTTRALLPWPVYALCASLCLIVVFTSFKLVSGSITPFLFALIGNGVNTLGHLFFVARARAQGRLPSLALPFSALMLAGLVGCILPVNDSSVVFMFQAGAPMSVALPVLTAGNVFLTVMFGLIVLNETMHFKRVVGLGFIIIGIVLLNV